MFWWVMGRSLVNLRRMTSLVRSSPFKKQLVQGMISSSSVAIWVNEPWPGVSSPALSLSMNSESASCWVQAGHGSVMPRAD